jgi:hypothetical protein
LTPNFVWEEIISKNYSQLQEKNFVLHMQTYMTSAEYVKLSKQVTYIENGENMILFHEEFVPTACIVTANARIQ